MVSRAERSTCETVRLVLANYEVAARIDVEDLSRLAGSLEYFVPEELRLHYESWLWETLDGVISLAARTGRERELEVLGLGVLMSNGAHLPLYVKLRVPPDGHSLEAYEIRFGEVGANESYNTRDKVWNRVYLLDGRADDLQWEYAASRE